MATFKVPVNDKDHIQGNINAPITLVEYGDYQCPYCGEAFPIIKRIQKHYGDNLRFVFRNFPLTEVHPFAEVSAETAEFAGAHNQFWEMHDLIYTNQDRLAIPLLLELTKSLNLSTTKLQEALQEGTYQEKIKSDFLSGVYSGVPGTPAFFINNEIYDGSFGFEDMIAAINQHLNRI